MNELISIIVPVYNTEKYLKKCLDSIVEQSYDNLEIILIDDGSNDNSKKICLEYAKKDNRIIYIEKENGGAATARNLGISKANGKYIGFVDSDDIIYKDMYLTLYNNLVKYNADLSICEISRFSDNVKFTNENNIKIYNKIETLKILLEDKKIGSYSVNKLCKLDLIKNVVYPIGKLQEDVGTVYKFIENADKIVYSNSKLYGYYAREDSVTKSINKKFIYDYFEMIEKRFNDLKKYDLVNYLILNKVNVILGSYIDLANNKELLKDKEFKQFMCNKYNELRKINKKNIRKINTKKHNILIFILLLNKNVFFKLINLYLRIK